MMKDYLKHAGWVALTVWLTGLLFSPAAQGAEKIKLLIMSGSHPFQTNQFFQVFKDNPEVTFVAVSHPAAQARLRPASAKDFDVLVLYDYWQPICEEAKADFLNFLKAGKGLVILHHAVANYQQWPEYEQILGGRYYLQKTNINGVEKLRSRAKHGAELNIHIQDAQHPITRGLRDFTIHDESYAGYDKLPDSHVLLTTDHTNNAPYVAWTRQYAAARVVYLQLGHDQLAYNNPNFRQLLAQSLRWVTKRD